MNSYETNTRPHAHNSLHSLLSRISPSLHSTPPGSQVGIVRAENLATYPPTINTIQSSMIHTHMQMHKHLCTHTHTHTNVSRQPLTVRMSGTDLGLEEHVAMAAQTQAHTYTHRTHNSAGICYTP